jgi:hypothetical protein
MAKSIEASEKRPCCLLLRELSKSQKSLQDPQAVSETLEVISRHCVLMKFKGKSKIKWDLSKSDCYLAVSPESSQEIVDECGKTVAVNQSLESYDALLAYLNGIIANNAVLGQTKDKIQVFLKQLREGEKRFGRVPDTSLTKETHNENALGAGDLLQAHPLLDKPQFDGITPKSNPNPNQNPDAAKNAEELQHQLQHQLQYQPKPQSTITPRFKPGG